MLMNNEKSRAAAIVLRLESSATNFQVFFSDCFVNFSIVQETIEQDKRAFISEVLYLTLINRQFHHKTQIFFTGICEETSS